MLIWKLPAVVIVVQLYEEAVYCMKEVIGMGVSQYPQCLSPVKAAAAVSHSVQHSISEEEMICTKENHFKHQW